MNRSISLSVETVAGGLRIYDDTGRKDRIPTELSVIAFRVQPALSVPFTVKTIMARIFSHAASFDRTVGDQAVVDQAGVEQAASIPLVIPSEVAN